MKDQRNSLFQTMTEDHKRAMAELREEKKLEVKQLQRKSKLLEDSMDELWDEVHQLRTTGKAELDQEKRANEAKTRTMFRDYDQRSDERFKIYELMASKLDKRE